MTVQTQDAAGDFWTTPEGISARIDMLADVCTWRVINGAMQVYASEAGAYGFEWISQMLPNTCNYCIRQDGKIFRRGQFMPIMPPHPNCKCHWDVTFE